MRLAPGDAVDRMIVVTGLAPIAKTAFAGLAATASTYAFGVLCHGHVGLHDVEGPDRDRVHGLGVCLSVIATHSVRAALDSDPVEGRRGGKGGSEQDCRQR